MVCVCLFCVFECYVSVGLEAQLFVGGLEGCEYSLW